MFTPSLVRCSLWNKPLVNCENLAFHHMTQTLTTLPRGHTDADTFNAKCLVKMNFHRTKYHVKIMTIYVSTKCPTNYEMVGLIVPTHRCILFPTHASLREPCHLKSHSSESRVCCHDIWRQHQAVAYSFNRGWGVTTLQSLAAVLRDNNMRILFSNDWNFNFVKSLVSHPLTKYHLQSCHMMGHYVVKGTMWCVVMGGQTQLYIVLADDHASCINHKRLFFHCLLTTFFWISSTCRLPSQ